MNMSRLILGLIIAMGSSDMAIAQIDNTAYGTGALASNSGSDNSGFGFYALFSNMTGDNNVASGSLALASNTTGHDNTASGFLALNSNTTGISNTASGSQALLSNTVGTGNTANGQQALYVNTTGIDNIAVGNYALYHTNGSNNIAIGYESGYWLGGGNNNIHIGHPGTSNDNNMIRIGKQSVQKYTAIAGISGVNVTGGAAVVVNKQGQLGVELSSIRYKEDVHSMGTASERLLMLRPVTFRYKQPDENGSKPQQYGLIAEEVAKVMPELVIFNDRGQPETVAYQTLAPLLLNELQKEHSELLSMRTQRAELEALRAEVAELRRAIGKK